jgi:hypothetical protein
MKRKCGKEEQIDCCTREERNGAAVIWKLRGIKIGFEEGRCPLCLEEEDVKHLSI